MDSGRVTFIAIAVSAVGWMIAIAIVVSLLYG